MLDAHVDTIELVFCDLQMPDMDGVEFIRHLGRINYRGCLVLVSGEGERIRQTAEKLAQAYRIDILGELSKPVDREQLAMVLGKFGTVRAQGHFQKSHSAFAPDELRQAIDNGELVNHYQPKIDFVTGKLVGVESLVRWQHPAAGLVFPDRFIGIAEDHALIDALTLNVLSMAFEQKRAWDLQGLAVHVAVNVSMDNLAVIDFPEVIARLGDAAGIRLSDVVLEVTESRLMSDLASTLDVLTRLRLRRVGLAIDDFGTGNSSLVQLRDFPFDELKMDRSFVHGSTTDTSLRAIVDGTLTMARGLGIKSVAEGVEHLADFQLMRSMGCSMGQGYLFGRPMPGNDLPGWNQDWNRRWQSGEFGIDP